MTEIQEKHYGQIKAFAQRNPWVLTDKAEGNCKRFDVQSGKFTCVVKVYTTGTILVQGTESKLKDSLTNAKTAIEAGEEIGGMLPFEIERFPEVLRERITDIDPVIVQFVEHAILNIKAGSNLGCAFLLGGASEKAVLLLIDAYTRAIADEANRQKFISRTSNRFIARAFEEFKASFKGSKTKPDGYGWAHDIEIKVEQIFTFCRISRNEAGHPHLPPNLDKGVLLANMGQFVKYIEDLYALIRFYSTNKVEL